MELRIRANSGLTPELRCAVISMIDMRFNYIKELLLMGLSNYLDLISSLYTRYELHP